MDFVQREPVKMDSDIYKINQSFSRVHVRAISNCTPGPNLHQIASFSLIRMSTFLFSVPTKVLYYASEQQESNCDTVERISRCSFGGGTADVHGELNLGSEALHTEPVGALGLWEAALPGV